MLRAVYTRRGPVPQDVIEAVPFEPPVPEAGEALVDVVAAPINPSDVLMLTGEYGRLPPLPAVGGTEGVGRVASLGPGADGPPVGTLVLLPPAGGTWASCVVVPAARLVPLPGAADPLQFAMMTVNPPTAVLLLSEFVTLSPSEWVIQNAANSAVGRYLVQLAAQRGLRTVGVVRRAEAAEEVRAAGADVVLVDGPDLRERVAGATGGAAIRLGIDAVAGAATGRLAACLAESATLVNYGRMSGEPSVIGANEFVFRDLTVRGFWLARWFQEAPAERRRALIGEVGGLIATGVLHAPVQATFDVSEIREAVALAAAGGRSGKVLVVPER